VVARDARFTIHLGIRSAVADWAGRRAWIEAALEPAWHAFVGRASPDQLALFGVPRPGHPYWTGDTVRGVGLRYPTLDMTPWGRSGHDDGREER
jgi:hypothetical protein